MFYISRSPAGKIVNVSLNYSDGASSRWDWHDYTAEQIEALALEVSEFTGTHIIAVDTRCSPRHDLVAVPKVGDKVSYGFNGDAYPCGRITRVSATLKVITTTDGKKFYRRGKSGAWVNGGTWSLMGGHHCEHNPHL